MKKPNNKLSRLCASWMLLLTIAFNGMTQVNFSVMPVKVDDDVTEEAAKVVFRKTEQILTRNSAGAAGTVDVFAVQPKLTITDKATSSGLIREINTVSGELQLVALNKVDNAKYYSVTVPLEGVAKGGGPSAAVLALANAIKPTDAVFTRFVRVAREKIEEYYSDNCQDILGRASNLGLSGQYAAALAYLTGMPASAPCHEEALEIINALRSKLDKDKADREESRRAKNANDSGIKKDIGSDDANLSKTPPASDGVPLGEIYVESPNWTFRIEEATYLPESRKVRIMALVSYVGKKSLSGDCVLGFRKALDAGGNSYDNCYVSGEKYRTFPENVPVKIEYFIDDVRKNPGILSFVGLSVDYKKIEIRNLKISE